VLKSLGGRICKINFLLPRIQGRFDVLITADRGIEFEHNLTKLRFGVVIDHVPKNKVEFYQPLTSKLLVAIEAVGPAP